MPNIWYRMPFNNIENFKTKIDLNRITWLKPIFTFYVESTNVNLN